MKKIKKIVFIILLFICFSLNIYANEFSEKSTLNISFVTENNSLFMENVDIYIYKLATFNNDDYSVKWNDIYSDFEFDLSTITDEEMISTSYELGEFVKEQNIDEDYKITTDFNGDANITFENGIYLICVDQVVKNKVIYTPYPCIIQMPYTDEDGSLTYKANIELKYFRKEIDQKIEEPAQFQTPPTNTQLPQKQSNIINTGDLVPIIFGVLILFSMIIILIMLELKKKNNNRN